MDGGGAGITLFPHDVPHTGDDGLGLGARQEIDFDFHPLADVIVLIHVQQHTRNAQVQDLSGVPL